MHLKSEIFVAGAMYEGFCTKFKISMRTYVQAHDFSLVRISEFVLLTCRCVNSYPDFLKVD